MNPVWLLRLFGLFFILTALTAGKSLAHCQIPCGIYDDAARVDMLLEDAQTISKSVHELIGHSKDKGIQAENQRVRWIINKDKHAEKIIQTVADYYLTQRIKPDQKDYQERLVRHHNIMLLAMRCKQTVDTKIVEQLVTAIKLIQPYYPKHQKVK